MNEKLKNKLYINFLLLVVAFSIFYFFTLPLYEGGGNFYNPKEDIKSLFQKKANYEAADKQAGDFIKKIKSTNDSYNSVSESQNFQGIDKMVPQVADPVEVVNELSNIAIQNGLLLESPKVNDDNGTSQNNYNTLTIDFKINTTYPSLKSFLRVLENSKRIYNVNKLSFSSVSDSKNTSVLTYQLSVETYYLKK